MYRKDYIFLFEPFFLIFTAHVLLYASGHANKSLKYQKNHLKKQKNRNG